MAGPLTWRNVDAPNFAPAFEGLRTASTLLGNATRSGQELVGQFTQARSDAADRAILNRSLGVQDSADFSRGLRDGSIVGPDMANASLATLRGLDSRVGALLDRDVTRQAYDQTGYTNQRGREGDVLLDAASPDLARARAFARQGNQAAVDQLISNSRAIQNLRPGQFNDAVTGVDATSSNFQNRRGSDANFIRDQYGFGRTVQGDQDSDAAAAALLRVRRNSGNTDDATRAVEAEIPNMTPGAASRLISATRDAGYPVYAPVGGTTGAGGGASVSPGSTPALGVMTGGAQLPDNIQTVGDIIDNKSSLLRTNPKGTATGLWQITSDTWKDFAPRVLGENWRNANIRDVQVQDQVAKAIWDDAKSSPTKIRNRWASVNADEAARMQNASWEDVRDLLSQKESSTRASEVLTATAQERAQNNLGGATASQLIRERAGQNQSVGIFPELNQLQGDRRDASAVVDSLTQADGPLRGSNRGQVLDYMNWIIQNSGGRINPAMAGEMLTRNLQSADNPLERAGSMIADVVGAPFGRRTRTANLGDGIRLNDRGVYQMMDDYLNGATSTQGQAQNSLAVVNQLVEQAQAQYNAAEAQYQAMLSASQSRPGLRGSLERYKAQRDAAEQALRRVSQSVVNNETLTPRFDQRGRSPAS